MNPLPPDPYIALGVGKDADVSAIKSAYRKLVLKCHPDKVQDPALKAIKQDEFQRVQQAYEILSDENKRREYDDEAKLKKLREEVMKNMPHHAASRPPPKNYYEFNVRTAEPPPSFRPGPPPRSPYTTGSPQFTTSWERDMPTRSKHIYEEDVDRKARRTASYEKPRKEDESKEERRRRKDAEEELLRERERRRDREKEKDRERKRDSERRERERERQKELDREARKAEEREARRAVEEKEARKAEERRIKKEQEKQREKERDRLRRQEQEEKLRQKKAPFIEHHDSSEDEHRVHKKKSSSSTKKHSDSPRRDKSSRAEAPPAVEPSTERKTLSSIAFAAEYMHQVRRKGSKSGASDPYGEAYSPNPNFPSPDTWHADTAAPRSRRGSHEDKKIQVTVEEEDEEAEVINISPVESGRPPRLQKSFTSPVGDMHMANSSAPRTPNLARAATMDYGRSAPPQAPPAPSPEARHSGKSDRRRRGSVDAYDDEPRSRRSGHHRYEDGTRVLQPEYRPVEEVYSSYGGNRGASFRKVRVAPDYDNVIQAQGYDEYKVAYTNVPYSSSPSYQYPQYVSG